MKSLEMFLRYYSHKANTCLWGQSDLWPNSDQVLWVQVNIFVSCNEIPFGHSWYIMFKQHKVMWPWPFYLWAPKSNQFIYECLYQSWIHSLKPILRYHVHGKHSLGGQRDRDLWTLVPKSNQWILDSKWMCVPNVKGFLDGVPEISPSQGKIIAL